MRDKSVSWILQKKWYSNLEWIIVANILQSNFRGVLWRDFYLKIVIINFYLKRLRIPGIKIDAVITDPPYGVSRKNQLGFSNMGRSGMNYGEWDYNFDQKEWIRLCAPLIKPGGSIIVFNDWKNFHI